MKILLFTTVFSMFMLADSQCPTNTTVCNTKLKISANFDPYLTLATLTYIINADVSASYTLIHYGLDSEGNDYSVPITATSVVWTPSGASTHTVLSTTLANSYSSKYYWCSKLISLGCKTFNTCDHVTMGFTTRNDSASHNVNRWELVKDFDISWF